MTYDDFITSTQPKVAGSWNLHTHLPRSMDFFILLSSVAGILGSPSQGNYAAGNTFMDALARHRTAMGEKAVSIDLGMMVSEGVVAETDGMLGSLRRLGYLMEVLQAEFLALLDHYCDPSLPVLSPDESQIIVGIETPAAMEAKGMDVPEWMQRPLFRHFRQIDAGVGADGPGSNSGRKRNVDLEGSLRQSVSTEEAAGHIADGLVKKLEQILGVRPEDVELNKPIHTNGINSLAAVELKNWFDKKVGAEVAVFEIVGNMSLTELAGYAAAKSRFRSA